MNSDPTSTALAEVEYPTEDDEPMGETPLHANVMRELVDILEERYANEPMTYVAGNMIFYYVEGNPRKQIVPDVFVAKGVTKDPDREIYLLWREGKGPYFVAEVTSRSTANKDLAERLRLYRDVLKVRESVLFDPRPKTSRLPLRGFRLVDGEYVPIEMVDGRLPSEVLGLHLERDGARLRLYDPEAKSWLLTFREKYELAEEARLRAEAKSTREETARRQAEAKSAQAEAEKEHLQRELDAARDNRTPSK